MITKLTVLKKVFKSFDCFYILEYNNKRQCLSLEILFKTKKPITMKWEMKHTKI